MLFKRAYKPPSDKKSLQKVYRTIPDLSEVMKVGMDGQIQLVDAATFDEMF